MADFAVDNAASLFIDQPLAEGLGSRTAVATPERAYTYAELVALVDRAAHGLRRLGIEPEQRVGLLMADGIGFATTFFGALKLGAVAVPLNTRLGAPELGVILDDCRARVVVADRELSAALAPARGAAVVDFETLVRGAHQGRVAPEAVGTDAFRSTRLCVSAGERLPAEVYQAWRERFGVEILDGIGATETIFMFISNRAGRSRAGSTGTPVDGTEVKLLDAAGEPVADGAQGVLWAKTPSTAAGYWKRLDHSRRTFVGDWFRTGDVYTRDADGFYTHCGREDDFFKVAGQWVVPADVEAALMQHPAVLEAGVVGAEEASGLVKPFVFVVPRDPGAEAGR